LSEVKRMEVNAAGQVLCQTCGMGCGGKPVHWDAEQEAIVCSDCYGEGDSEGAGDRGEGDSDEGDNDGGIESDNVREANAEGKGGKKRRRKDDRYVNTLASAWTVLVFLVTCCGRACERFVRMGSQELAARGVRARARRGGGGARRHKFMLKFLSSPKIGHI
jgi:hypothetical protein